MFSNSSNMLPLSIFGKTKKIRLSDNSQDIFCIEGNILARIILGRIIKSGNVGNREMIFSFHQVAEKNLEKNTEQ